MSFEKQHKLVDWMADYLESVEDRPVKSQVKPGEIRANLSESPPQEGGSFDLIFKDFKSVLMPGNNPLAASKFFAYFPANISHASLLGEMLTATLAAQCMIWDTSPAAAELERTCHELAS